MPTFVLEPACRRLTAKRQIPTDNIRIVAGPGTGKTDAVAIVAPRQTSPGNIARVPVTAIKHRVDGRQMSIQLELVFASFSSLQAGSVPSIYPDSIWLRPQNGNAKKEKKYLMGILLQSHGLGFLGVQHMVAISFKKRSKNFFTMFEAIPNL